MKILFVAAEAAPLVKVGGLADVAGSLPRALAGLGHDVRVMLPAYGCVDVGPLRALPLREAGVPVFGTTESVHLSALDSEGNAAFYLVGNDRYFGGQQVYTDNDLERFFLFSRAACQLIPDLEWQPQIIHCHDWHAGLLPAWLSMNGGSYATVFTIHNLAYQGAFGDDFMGRAQISGMWSDLPAGVPHIPLTFMTQGILRADAITTVSETYAREITTHQYGAGLDSLLRYRSGDLTGIVNGIDTVEYDPARDRYIGARYDAKSAFKKDANKLLLQKSAGLPQDSTVPMLGMVSRLDEQKGLDILERSIDSLAARNMQLVVLGRGRPNYESMVRHAAQRHPGKIAAAITFDDPLAHLVYAGSDMFLMPSRFEPCGLGQLIAMRYGTIPVVRRTGGLVETVPDVTEDLAEGRGFVFDTYEPGALLDAVDRGLRAWEQRKHAWMGLVERVMGLDFTWRASARKYETVYRNALETKG